MSCAYIGGVLFKVDSYCFAELGITMNYYVATVYPADPVQIQLQMTNTMIRISTVDQLWKFSANVYDPKHFTPKSGRSPGFHASNFPVKGGVLWVWYTEMPYLVPKFCPLCHHRTTYVFVLCWNRPTHECDWWITHVVHWCLRILLDYHNDLRFSIEGDGFCVTQDIFSRDPELTLMLRRCLRLITCVPDLFAAPYWLHVVTTSINYKRCTRRFNYALAILLQNCNLKIKIKFFQCCNLIYIIIILHNCMIILNFKFKFGFKSCSFFLVFL